jgi:dTDP-4-amino-4,6-dideoxygalactose transaminase
MDIPIVRLPFEEGDIERLGEEFKGLLRGGHIAFGPMAEAFERGFAGFLGAGEALGTGSGTQALELLCRALDLRGASVMVPGLTFMATAFAALAAGARVILVDVDPLTLQMDPGDLERKMRPDVGAVILVHLGGFVSPDIGRIRDIAHGNGALLLEDAAHAHGARAFGRMAGTLGDAAAFSFYATKPLTTSEGGMVVTADAALMGRMRAIRQHGQGLPGSNVHESFGLNFRPSEIHALLGLNLLPRARALIEGRRAAAAVYDRLLSGGPLRPLLPAPGIEPSYYKYIAFLPEGVGRDDLKRELKGRHGLRLAGETYATPLHLQPFWAGAPWALAGPPEGLPNSELAAARQICLPIWPGIPESDQERVVGAILQALGSL